MPASCCVIDCTNRFISASGVHFFRFPEHDPKRTAWINAIRRKNWTPSESSRVCSVHFLSGKLIVLKARTNARNISTQHCIVSYCWIGLDRVVRCCEGAGRDKQTLQHGGQACATCVEMLRVFDRGPWLFLRLIFLLYTSPWISKPLIKFGKWAFAIIK